MYAYDKPAPHTGRDHVAELPGDYLTLAAAAELLTCDQNAVLSLADVGFLHLCRAGNRLMVSRAEVLGLLDASTY